MKDERTAHWAVFAIGGLIGITESLLIRNPVKSLFFPSDPTSYFFAFLAYGVTCWLLVEAAWLILRTFHLSPLPGRLSLGLSGFAMLAVFYAKKKWVSNAPVLTWKGIMFPLVSLLVLSLIITTLYHLFRRHQKLSSLTVGVSRLLSLVLIPITLIYGFVPAYRFLPSNQADSKLPNIILLSLDTTGAGHLSSYGYSRKTSPFLDSLAEKGVLFEDAYTVVTWTLPSHASLFTGQLPLVHGVGFNHFFLSQSVTTLAEALKDKGYATASFIGGPFLISDFQLTQGFDYYDERLDPHSKLKRLTLFRVLSRVFQNELWITDGQRSADVINQKLYPYLEWVKDREPFFLFVNYFDPHEPYDPPEHAKELLHLPPVSITGHIRHFYINQETGRAIHKNGVPLTEQEFEQLRSLYDAEIRFLDEQIEDLWKKLESENLLENTIVIILSDHGESIGEHGILDHGHTLYQEQVRIPLIIIGPQPWQGGRRISDPVQTTDIYPTILQTLGLPVPEDIQGRSLLPLLQSGSLQDRAIMAEIDADPHPRYTPYRRSLQMILKDSYKYIEASNDRNELFNLAADPQEVRNLIRDHPELAGKLSDEIQGHASALKVFKHQGSGEMDEDNREKLKALGYLE